ncbi:hypothetical protein LTR95_000361 [Oleoguttula sp. CCFEE 5521]
MHSNALEWDKQQDECEPRVWIWFSRQAEETESAAYDDSVVPSKDSELIQSSDKIPARSDVAGEEDAKGDDGYWVHGQVEVFMSRRVGLCRIREGDLRRTKPH